MPGGEERNEKLFVRREISWVNSDTAVTRSRLTSHQCVTLIVVMQKRLLESVGYVRVAGAVLEVTLAEPVE